MKQKINMGVETDKVSTQYKKELLIRRAHGVNILSSYLKKISSVFKINESQIELLSLFNSDNIFFNKEYNKNYLIVEKKEFFLINNDFPYSFLKKELFRKSFFVFMDDDWKYCGAFLLPDDFDFYLRFGSETDQIGEEISIISSDQNLRILLDYTKERDNIFLEYTLYRDVSNK